MKNLKRALSFALAAVMLVGMMVVGAGAAFTDADEIVNDEAVNTLVALNVLNGKGDGSYFDPTAVVTRGEMAKMITVALNGGKAPVIGTKVVPTYADIDGHWAEAFIEYCSNLGIIAGYEGKFRPDDTVTGTEAAKMMLVAQGWDATIFGFTGNDWALNVNTEANKVELYDGLEDIDPAAGLSRDNAAQLVYNGILAPIMEKSPNMTITNGSITWDYDLVETKSIFSTKYSGKVWVGSFDGNYNTGATGTVKGEIQVNGKLNNAEEGVSADTAEFPSALDIAYIGEEVKVLFKDVKGGTTGQPDSKDVIYGTFVTGATDVLNVISNDIASGASAPTAADEIKVAGTVYDVVNPASSTALVVTNFDVSAPTNGTDAKAAFEALSKQNGDAVKFIMNSDGKIVKAYVTASTLSYVTAVNAEKVTVYGVGALKVADHEIYAGAAKDDIVVVTTLYDADDADKVLHIVKKAEIVAGKVDGFKTTDDPYYENVVVDGTTYKIYNKALMPTYLPGSTDVASFAYADIGETFNLYMVNGYVAGAKKTSATANNYSLVIDVNSGTAGDAWSPLKIQVLAADGTKTILTVDKTGDTTLAEGDIITWTGTEAKAKITIKADWSDSPATSTSAFYDEDAKTVQGVATTADAVLFVQTKDTGAIGYVTDDNAVTTATYKAYAIRSLDDITTSGKNYKVVTNSANKVVAAVIDLAGKPSGATDNTVYGIISAYVGTVDVDDTEYNVYTIVNDTATYTVKIETVEDGVMDKGDVVAFEPSVDGLYDTTVSTFTAAGTAYYVKEWNEADSTITYVDMLQGKKADGTDTSTASEIAYYAIHASATTTTKAVEEDAQIIYVDAKNDKAGTEIGVVAFDVVTGYKNAIIIDADSNGAVDVIIVETSNEAGL